MRGFVAIVALIVAIGGLLLVIAYGASDAYLNYQSDETDLDDSLLVASLAPQGWSAAAAPSVNFNAQFIAPCLQTPLLEGASTSGRGATSYVPPGSAAPGAQLLLIQTSPAAASGILDDVARDTENNCQRGLTVGTVERAEVDTGSVAGAERSIAVRYDRQVGEATRSFLVLVLQQAGYVAHLSYETTDAPGVVADALTSLGAALVARIDLPPTTAQLAAAGALDEPTAMERRMTRVNEASDRILTLSGRYPITVGLGGLGAVVLLMYVAGARLSRGPGPLPDTSGLATAPGAVMPGTPPKTVDDYGVPERRWIQTSEGRKSKRADPAPVFMLDIPELEEDEIDEPVSEPEPEPEPSGPPPVIDFPQRSIEEKLKILKDARLKEPRREHRAMRDVTPAVDWTEEISKPERRPDTSELEPPTGQISRKALLKKLRSNADSE